jgi:hypothetical protein
MKPAATVAVGSKCGDDRPTPENRPKHPVSVRAVADWLGRGSRHRRRQWIDRNGRGRGRRCRPRNGRPAGGLCWDRRQHSCDDETGQEKRDTSLPHRVGRLPVPGRHG